LESVKTSELGGHTVGRMKIDGDAILEVYFQNENLLAYRNGEQLAQAPDTISVVNEDGIGVSNGHIPEQGESVGVYELSYGFWEDAECFNLETLGIKSDEESVSFNGELEYEVRGEPQ
jgi:DUF917 family protein